MAARTAYSRRSRRKQPNYSLRVKRWIGMVVVIVILMFIVFNRHGMLHLYRLRAEQEHLEAEIAILQERAAELRREVASLQSDMSYIERLAREKYRMVKRGEKVFRVIQSSPEPGRDEGEPAPR
ncbi:MAG: septum formation initiator family protein [Fidelibacterota bacterium]|nr:MAG: septum formation initiator family protein [Candidatus Neomarinimicrobiota bacterium]